MSRRLALLLVLLFAPTMLGAMQTESIDVCPVLAGETLPPSSYDRPGCERLPLHAIDPQGRDLWIRLIPPPPPTRDGGFLGLLIAAKASSEVFLDGRRIGSNGQPGADAASETVGRMDVVIPVDPRRMSPEGSRFDLRMSAHHGWLHLTNPIHAIALVEHPDPQAVTLRYYLPALLPLGVFLLAGFYFFSLTLRSERRVESALLGALATLAGIQLLLEVSRGVFAYAYPIHEWRLLGVLACSIGFGLCLVAVSARSFAPRALWPALALGAVGMGAGAWFRPGLDGKTAFALFLASLIALVLSGIGAVRGIRGARVQSAALLVFALANAIAPDRFLDQGFYLLVAALMIVLMILQAVAYGRERRLRAEQRLRADRLQRALDQVQAERAPPTLSIPGTGTLRQIAVDRIVRIQGAGDYSELHLDDGSRHLHSATLNELDADLPPNFLRVHRSHLVNTRFIDRLERSEGGTGTLHLRVGQSVPVSRRVMPGVRRALR